MTEPNCAKRVHDGCVPCASLQKFLPLFLSAQVLDSRSAESVTACVQRPGSMEDGIARNDSKHTMDIQLDPS